MKREHVETDAAGLGWLAAWAIMAMMGLAVLVIAALVVAELVGGELVIPAG